MKDLYLKSTRGVLLSVCQFSCTCNIFSTEDVKAEEVACTLAEPGPEVEGQLGDSNHRVQ